jgi:hypothetical protein
MRRKGDQLEGEWMFAHFQMTTPITGNAVATRVHSFGEWDPWESLDRDREQQVVDINRVLLEKAPTKSFEKFLTYWNKIEPAYYFFVQDWLYGREAGDSQPREERLRAVFETLKGSRAEKELIKVFPQLVEECLRESKPLLEVGSKVHFVSSFPGTQVGEATHWTRIPEPGEKDSCDCSFLNLGERYVSFDPAGFASYGDLSRVILRKEIFRRILWKEEKRETLSDEMSLLQQGLALQFALKAEEKEFPELEPSELKELFGLLRSATADGSSNVSGNDLRDHPLYAIGYDFAAELLETRSAKEVVGLKQGGVAAEWQRYVGKFAVADSEEVAR